MVDYLHKRIVLRKKLRETNTWVSETNGIVLTDTKNERVSIGLGKKRDSFNFDIKNANNRLFERYYSGDGTETDFTLNFSPIPSDHLTGTDQKFFVYVNDLLLSYSTDYTVSGDTITFTSAPSSGNRNIRIVYPVIEADDIIDIYFWKNSDWSSLTTQQKNDARKIEGPVIEPSITRDNNILNVRGYGLIDTIFSGMAFALFDPDIINRAHLAIQQIIAQLNQFNPNRRIYGENPAEWAALDNAETSLERNYHSKYRTAIEMIEELSGNQYTGNGQYIYYVQYNPTEDRYEFIWKAKPLNADTTLQEGVEPENIKISKATDEVVNVIIYNAGNDCFGNGQEYLNYDFTISGYGSRWKYVSDTSTISQSLINAEFESDPDLWDTGEERERTENFPLSYPYTFAKIRERDETGTSTGGTLIVNTDKEFNQVIREESKWVGKSMTNRYIELYSNPRYKVTLFIPYTNDITPVLGDRYLLTFPCFGLNAKKLRLFQIDYEFWGYQLQLEEDETTD